MFRRTRKNPTATIKDFTEGPVIPDAAADYFDAANFTFDADGYPTIGGNRTGNALSFLPAGAFNSLAGKPALGASGVVGNGVTDDLAALTSSDTAAVTANLTLLLLPGTYKVSSNLTINSPIWFAPGATIKPDIGQVVTLAGGVFAAPNRKIFDHSAGGKVVPLKTDFYRPQWWGASGSANDSQAWIDMSESIDVSVMSLGGIKYGQKVLAPPGVNRIVGVTLSSCIIHAGLGGSVFVPPNGTTSGTVLALGNFSQLIGGSFTTTESTQAVTCLHLTGQRAHADGVYAINQAPNSTAVKLGNSLGQGTISPLLTNARLISGLSDIAPVGAPAAGSIGIDIQTSDAQLSNVNVAQYDTGITSSLGSARLTNVHVWGNNTGLKGAGWDNCQLLNVYLDNNRVWGADIDRADRLSCHNVYVWLNGHAGAGGGIRLTRPSGSGSFSTFKGVVLDDNVGYGAYIDGPGDYEFECVITSATQSVATNKGQLVTPSGPFTLTYSGQTTATIATTDTAEQCRAALEALSNIAPADIVSVLGGKGRPFVVTFANTVNGVAPVLMTASGATVKAPITDVGVEVTSSTLRLTLDIQGTGATTALTNNSTTTSYGRWARNVHAAASKTTPVDADEFGLVDSAASNGTKRITWANLKSALIPPRIVATSNLVKNADTAVANLLSMPLLAGKKYAIRGVILVAGNQAADMKFRLQNTSGAPVSGWFAPTNALATTSTAATAASMLVTTADIAASAGVSVASGVVTGTRSVVQFTGYLETGAGSNQKLECQVSQFVSDASDTTFYAGSWMEAAEVA